MSYMPNRILQLREEKGLKQATVADDLHMSRSTLSGYEMGKMPSIQHAIALAGYYQVSLDYIVGLSSERSAAALVSSFITLQNLAGSTAPTASDVSALVDAAILYLCSGKPCGEQPITAWRDFMRSLTACLTAAVQGDGAQLLDNANAAAVAALDVTKMPGLLRVGKGE